MFEFNVTGIEDAIKAIESFAVTIPDKMDEVIERLMNDGYSIASAAFAKALYSGENDVIVDPPVWEGDTMVMYANGEAVAFIEFGTGKKYEKYPEQIPGSKENPYVTLHLSAREEYGKKKAKRGKWQYVGEPGNLGKIQHVKKNGELVIVTEGNPPARAMYGAAEAVANRERALEIAREVFNR